MPGEEKHFGGSFPLHIVFRFFKTITEFTGSGNEQEALTGLLVWSMS